MNRNPLEISFVRLLMEDFRTHGSNPFEQGFWAIAVHRYGNWRMGIRNRLIRLPLSVLYRVLEKLVQCLAGISLSWDTRIGRRVRIWHFGGIIIHAHRIGDDCQIRQNTTMGVRAIGDSSLPVIEERVDIGCGTVILGGVRIGHDSIIGANAVVIRDVPPHAVAVGVPARVIADHSAGRDGRQTDARTDVHGIRQ